MNPDKDYDGVQPEKNACGGYYCSPEHGHIDCQPRIQMHVCDSIGVVIEGITVIEKPNALGGTYFYATAKIEAIYGSEVDGEIHGIGATKEQAIERLKEEKRKLAESIQF